MSKPDTADDADGSDGHRVPTQDEYEDEVFEKRWVELEDFDGHVQVRELPPMRLLRDMEQYQVQALMGGDDDELDAKNMLRDGDLNGFIDNTVLPNVLKPNCYWTIEVDDGPDRQIGAGDFDLSSLSTPDLMAVIKGMIAADDDELAEMAEQKRSFLE